MLVGLEAGVFEFVAGWIPVDPLGVLMGLEGNVRYVVGNGFVVLVEVVQDELAASECFEALMNVVKVLRLEVILVLFVSHVSEWEGVKLELPIHVVKVWPLWVYTVDYDRLGYWSIAGVYYKWSCVGEWIPDPSSIRRECAKVVDRNNLWEGWVFSLQSY